jgi:hypothetical protein
VVLMVVVGGAGVFVEVVIAAHALLERET